MASRWLQKLLVLSLCLTHASRAQDGDSATGSANKVDASQTAVVLPAGFYVEDGTPSSSFSAPVAVAFAPDGRIFVAEQRGRVYVVEGETKLEPPFINLEAEVLNHWDRGLLGIAIDPNFEVNRYVYLLYTYDRDGSGDYQRQDAAARLTRYAADANNVNVADLSTRAVLIGPTFPEAIPSCYYSHTIGTLQFGTDGTLLVGTGDGADFTTIDPGGRHPDCFGPGKFADVEDVGAFRSQYLGSLAGKILRVDPATGLGISSNPFFTGNASDNQSRVWARGLRNPFRFTLRRDGSTNPSDGNPGALYIGDVGWNTWEDLNVSRAGGDNFGWPCYEGPNQHAGYQGASPAHSDCTQLTSHTLPQSYWHHSNASLSSPAGLESRAVVVGDLYGGYPYPVEYRDRIYYADYIKNWIGSASADGLDNLSDHQVFATNAGNVVDIRYDSESGYLYWVDFGPGKVRRLRHIDEVVLDVELEVFTAVVRGGRVVLAWTVAEGADDTDFNVEQRAPGRQEFEEIGAAISEHDGRGVRDYVFVTSGDQPPGQHAFRLRHANTSGGFSYSREIEVDVPLVESYRIESAYPNPFRTTTTLRFSVADDQHVVVELYDVVGRYRRGLYSARVRANVREDIVIDRSELESGLYLVRFRGERFVADRKVLVMK